MKKNIFALLLCVGFALPALGQSNPPLRLQEIDGTPNVLGVTTIKVTNGTLSCSGKVCTITISGGGGGSPGGADTNVQFNDSASFGGNSGFVFDKTSKISLGVAGTSVGAIGFRNATSGTITLEAVTGALGTVTLSLPAATDTLVGKATTDTFTNKTFDTAGTGNSFSINGVAVTANTGTGAVARATSPTFVTPVLGAATGTSLTVTGNLQVGSSAFYKFGSLNALGYADTIGPTIADGNTGNVLTFNVQSLSVDRVVTWPDVALTVAGINVANAWADGIKQTFNPDGTNAGINVGSVAGDPSAPANADIWYDSTANELTARINGANVVLGAGGLPGGSDTQLQRNNAGAFGGISGATSDGTNVTFGSGNLRATSPRITTNILDANGLAILAFSPAASAINNFTISSTASTAADLTLSATGTDSNIGISILAKGVSNPSKFRGGTTDWFHQVDNSTGFQTGNATSAYLIVNGSSIKTANNHNIGWSSTSSAGGSLDTGLARQAAAVVRLTNGSTGAGSLVLGTSTVGSIGTSGVGVFAIANGTAPSSSPADEFQLYSADSAAGDANAFARNEAGEINRLTGLAARNSSSFAKTTDTTLANITGLTRNVEAGRAYAFTATLQTTAAATGGVKFAVSGTATATSISYEGVLVDMGVVVAQTRATALDTTVCASTTSTVGTCTIKGVVVINSGGTLTIQFAQNASDGGASTVLVNQFMQLVPIS